MDDSKRKARAEAMAKMLSEESKTMKKPPSNSTSNSEMVLCDPNELMHHEKWSKTKISQQIPGWSVGHKREIDYLNKWIKSLWEEHERGSSSQIRSPPLSGGPAGLLLRTAFSELLCREMIKGVAQKLPERIWATQYADLEPLLKASRVKPPLGSHRLKEVQDCLSRRLSCAVTDYVTRVKRVITLSASSQRNATLHSFFVAIGDLHRYQHNVAMGTGDDVSKPLESAEQYYWQALSLQVGSGKVWNQLAVCALTKLQHRPTDPLDQKRHNNSSENIFIEGDLLSTAAYRYLRALTSLSPFPSKENLLPLTAKLSALRGLLPAVSSLGRHITGEEHRVRFRVFLTSAAAAVFARIGLSSALPPRNVSGGGSRLSGYLGGGKYSGDSSNDSCTLARRHLRLWVAELTKSSIQEETQHCSFHSSSFEIRQYLGEAVILLFSTALAIGQDILKKTPDLEEIKADEAWECSLRLIEALVEELLAIPDVFGLGGLYIVMTIVFSSQSQINHPIILSSLYQYLKTSFQKLSNKLADYLNVLVSRDAIAASFSVSITQTDNIRTSTSWEDQEGSGSLCWSSSESEGNVSDVSRTNPKSEDWTSLALGVLQLSLCLTKEPSTPSLTLTFNQRGRAHFSGRASDNPVEEVDNVSKSDADSLLDLLRGVNVDSDHTNVTTEQIDTSIPVLESGNQDSDDEEEFLLLKPVTVTPNKTQPQKNPSKSEESEGLCPFFASGGALPEGLDSLMGELEAEEEPTALQVSAPPGFTPKSTPLPPPQPKAGMLVGVSIPPAPPQRQQGNTFSKRRNTPNKHSTSLPLIVLDAPNIAMRHGSLQGEFSSQGIAFAAAYFGLAGHRVVGFLPDFLLDFEKVAEKRRAQRLEVMKGDIRKTQLPNDVKLLRDLVSQGLLIGTPPQDYDDSYCIRYAQSHGGYVVTNDMYRDHVSAIKDRQTRETQRNWTKSHLISYTFVGDEFLPNPNFNFEQNNS